MSDDALLAELGEIARARAVRLLTWSAQDQVRDVVQDALVDFERYAATHEVEHPDRLIRVITTRRAMKYRDAWEHRRRWPALDDERDGGGVEEELAPGHVDDFAAVEGRDAVEWALGELPDDLREVARLAYLETPALTGPEIAVRLRLADGTVRNRLVRVRRLLRDLFAEPDEGS